LSSIIQRIQWFFGSLTQTGNENGINYKIPVVSMSDTTLHIAPSLFLHAIRVPPE